MNVGMGGGGTVYVLFNALEFHCNKAKQRNMLPVYIAILIYLRHLVELHIFSFSSLFKALRRSYPF